MRNHLVRKRPLGHAEMTRMETIVLAAGWSTALVAIFIRPIGIGKAMIVCSCNVFSDHQVRSVVVKEARRPRMSEVYACLRCSAQCGRCARRHRSRGRATLRRSGSTSVVREPIWSRSPPRQCCWVSPVLEDLHALMRDAFDRCSGRSRPSVIVYADRRVDRRQCEISPHHRNPSATNCSAKSDSSEATLDPPSPCPTIQLSRLVMAVG